jgi:hypothetical protein
VAGKQGPPKHHVWLIRLCWVLLIVVLYGGVIGLDSLLHPHGKGDPKGIPIALYGLATVFIGGGLITWMSRK